MAAHDFTLPTARSALTSPDRSGESHYELAVVRFAAIHEMLTELGEGFVLSRVLRRNAWDALELARDALGPVEAKRAQIEATKGRPLTVCFGCRRHRQISELRQFVDAEIAWGTFGDGCGRIFADSVTDSRPVFARYCPVCREKSEARRRVEILARAIAASEGRFLLHGGWRLTCKGCGERFSTASARRRRCDNCRH
jgi:hypothetical protein